MQKERNIEGKGGGRKGVHYRMVMSKIVPGKRPRGRPRKRCSNGF